MKTIDIVFWFRSDLHELEIWEKLNKTNSVAMYNVTIVWSQEYKDMRTSGRPR